MTYVYQQFPRPSNATGVSVVLSVIDANGNYRDIGTTTTSTDGVYSFAWTPDISGEFTVYASFEGSKSYYPSRGQAAFVIESEQATPSPTDATNTSAADIYLLPGIIAIIIAIIVVGVALATLMTRKRP
ncbi:MAG: hypothetical protein GX799_04525 [Crenarchaeota archaeon]|nr:hypothetical protein [Thermoproteota archaeon]